jgi:lactate dehydrogenase-like 2-hydroxyacid dehydrogenase
MTLPKIVFLDAATFGDVSLERFGEIGDCKIYQVTKPSETIGRLAGQNIVVTNKRGIDALALAAPELQDLSLIAVAATGTDISITRRPGNVGSRSATSQAMPHIRSRSSRWH